MKLLYSLKQIEFSQNKWRYLFSLGNLSIYSKWIKDKHVSKSSLEWYQGVKYDLLKWYSMILCYEFIMIIPKHEKRKKSIFFTNYYLYFVKL